MSDMPDGQEIEAFAAADPSGLMATGHWPQSEHGRAMQLGLMVPISETAAFGGTPSFADMVEMSRVAREVGFDAVWFADHFAFGARDDDEGLRGVWECWTVMAGVAARTEEIQIGALVACTGFRNPGLIAKMAESIDEISGGRFILGLGAGWHQPEYDMFGFPFDHRVSRFEEAISIIQPLLRTGEADFRGTYFQANQAVNRPRGPRPSGPPILVGSSGERMLGIMARYADAWNTVWHKDPEEVIKRMSAVDRACREIGRAPETLVRTAGGNIALTGYLGRRPDPITGDTETMARSIAAFAGAGIHHFVCGLDPCTPASIKEFAPVIGALDRM